jgi:alcohol dehydrogenase (cytochrome c)
VLVLLVFPVALALLGLSGSPIGAAEENVDSSWSSVGQNQENTWYSPQTMINPANVAGLHLDWSANISNIAGTPVIVNGTVYVSTGGFGTTAIYALNEQTGQVIWADGPGLQTGLNFTTTSGVTVADGQVFAGTLDSHLVSLDAKTGALNWQVSIDAGIVGNPIGYYIGPQAVPLVFQGRVMIADTEGDIGARGFIRAFNESNGNLLWTFYTVPPSPMNNDDQAFYKNSWGNCSECSGGDIWNVPAVDPSTGIIYFGTGNASPSYNGSQRDPSGNYSNLYSDSVIALDSRTGQMVWYYQESPGDSHDWDQGMPPALFTTNIEGKETEVVGVAGKSGFYYELNADTGALIFKVPLGIHYNDDKAPTQQGVIVYPGSFGGVNTYYTYDPMTNMAYVMTYNQPNNYTEGLVNGDGSQGSRDNPVPGVEPNCTLYAINASNGTVEWTKNYSGLGGGVSSTNNLVFTSDGSGNFYALEADNGEVLWKYKTEGQGFLGLWNWGPPSVTDGMLFETLFGTNYGGVLAFTTNTAITESSYPTTTTSSSVQSASSSSSSPSSTQASAASSTQASSYTAKGWTVTVQVESAQNGVPVSGAAIYLETSSLQVLQSGTTDDSGSVSFPGVPSGVYVIVARHAGQSAQSVVQVSGPNAFFRMVLGSSVGLSTSTATSTQLTFSFHSTSSTPRPVSGRITEMESGLAVSVAVAATALSGFFLLRRRRR